MTTKEIRDKETEQLRNDLIERRRHLFDLRSQAVTEKLEDPSQLGKTRKEIARILTILRQRETAEQATGNQKAQAAATTQPAAQA